jgi:hypothetical protein
MSREDAEKYQHHLQQLSKPHVEDAYRNAFSDCALMSGQPPTPRTIQRLLCVWKVLWRWRERETRR